MKKWEQRRLLLLEELSRQGRLSLSQVRELLNISESTARRLIIELEQDHCLIRRFGGIQKIEPSSPKYSYEENITRKRKSRSALMPQNWWKTATFSF